MRHEATYRTLLGLPESVALPPRLVEIHQQFEANLKAVQTGGSVMSNDCVHLLDRFLAEKKSNANAGHRPIFDPKEAAKPRPEPAAMAAIKKWSEKVDPGTQVRVKWNGKSQLGIFLKVSRGKLCVELPDDDKAFRMFDSSDVKIVEQLSKRDLQTTVS